MSAYVPSEAEVEAGLRERLRQVDPDEDGMSSEEVDQIRADVEAILVAAHMVPAAALDTAWDAGATTALRHAIRNDDGITLRLEQPNPYRAEPTDAQAMEAFGEMG